jgi:tripartite-type tricarboxylate transporter receptor subunit TctC
LERVNGWNALYGPPKMDPTLVNRWSELLRRLAGSQDWLAGVQNIGSIANVMSPADTARFVSDQYDLYSQLGKKLGIQIK